LRHRTSQSGSKRPCAAITRKEGIQVIEALVRETLKLVERHMPDANPEALRYAPGARQRPWGIADLNGR
jgi:hypothetical protein